MQETKGYSSTLFLLSSFWSLLSAFGMANDGLYYNQSVTLPNLPDYVLKFDDDPHTCAVQRHPYLDSLFINIVRTDVVMGSTKGDNFDISYRPADIYYYDINAIIKQGLGDIFNFYIESRSEIPFTVIKGFKKDSYYLDQNALKISFDLGNIHRLNVNDVEILVHGQGRIANKKKNYKAKLLFKFIFVTHQNAPPMVPQLYFAPPWRKEKPSIALKIFEEPLIGSTLYMANAFISYFDGYAPLIVYKLIRNPQNFFFIDALTGVITVAKVIDIEGIHPKTNLILEVEASAYERLPYVIAPRSLVLNVTVFDLNDNPPVTEHKEYRFNVLENATHPLNIFQFKVEDADVTRPAIHRFKISQVKTGIKGSDETATFAFLTPTAAHDLISDKRGKAQKQPKNSKQSEDLIAEADFEEGGDDFGDDFNKEGLDTNKETDNFAGTNNVLVLTKSANLDRERVPRYTLLVTITDVTPETLDPAPLGPRHKEAKANSKLYKKTYFYTKILIVIDVLDVNDNRPVCGIDKKTITVSDDIKSGTPIGVILSQDLDDPKSANGQVHHFLNSIKDDLDIVSVEQESGIIRIKSSLAEYPDYSVKRFSYRSCNVIGGEFQNFCCHGNFVLKVRNFQRGHRQSENNGKDGQSEIKIYQPEDIYDSVDIPEDSPLGSRVYEIKAKIFANSRELWKTTSLSQATSSSSTTEEYSWQRKRRQKIYYKIEPVPIYSEDYLSFFVHPKTGIIYTKAIMDAEQKRVYNIKIKASTGDLLKHDTKLLSIHIRDINDSPPIFLNKSENDPIIFELRRDSSLGARVGGLAAWDADVEEANSKIFYHLTYDSSYGKLKLDMHTGDIFVNGNLSRVGYSPLLALEESYAFIVKVTNSKNLPSTDGKSFKLRYNAKDPSTIRVRFELMEDLTKFQNDPQFIKSNTKQYNMEIPSVEPIMDQPQLNLPIGSMIKGSQLEKVSLLDQSYCYADYDNSIKQNGLSWERANQNCHSVSWVDNALGLAQDLNQAGLVKQDLIFQLMGNKSTRAATYPQTLMALAQISEPMEEIPNPMMPFMNGYLKVRVGATKAKPRPKSLRNGQSFIDISAYYLWDSYKSKFILEFNPENSQKNLLDIKNYFNSEMANQNLELKLDSLNYYMKNEGVLSLNYSEACFHLVQNGVVLEPSETFKLITENPKLWNYVRKRGVVQIKKCFTDSLYKRNPLEIILFGLGILLFISINLLNLILFFYKRKVTYYTKEDLSPYANNNNDFGRGVANKMTDNMDFYFGEQARNSLVGSRDSKSLDFYEWQEKSMDMIEVGPYKDKNDARMDTTYYEISKNV